MSKEGEGEETRKTANGYRVNEAESEGEGMCKQPICTGLKFKSISAKLL